MAISLSNLFHGTFIASKGATTLPSSTDQTTQMKSPLHSPLKPSTPDDQYYDWPLKKIIYEVFAKQDAEYKDSVIISLQNSFFADTDLGFTIKSIMTGQHPKRRITSQYPPVLDIIENIRSYCKWPKVNVVICNKDAMVKHFEKRYRDRNRRIFSTMNLLPVY